MHLDDIPVISPERNSVCPVTGSYVVINVNKKLVKFRCPADARDAYVKLR
jgi:hypothetical protein